MSPFFVYPVKKFCLIVIAYGYIMIPYRDPAFSDMFNFIDGMEIIIAIDHLIIL